MNKIKYLHIFSAATLFAAPLPALAQTNYPTKPIRMIVAFAPGGTTDILGRLVAQKLGEKLGQQVVIDNRGGAGGTIGTEIAARAPADGYTLTMGTTSTHVIARGAYKVLKYDPVKDFEPITLAATTPNLLTVNPQLKAHSLKEFIALARAQPGKLNYASAGTGTTTHLGTELLKIAAGIDLVHLPFTGNAPAGIATISGQAHVLFGSMPAVLPLAKSGRLRALAVGSPKRSPALPDLPAVAETFPGFDAQLWLAFFAPKGTPAPLLKRLHGELTAIVLSPEMKEHFERNGAEPHVSTPAELSRLLAGDLDKYLKAMKVAGIEPQ